MRLLRLEGPDLKLADSTAQTGVHTYGLYVNLATSNVMALTDDERDALDPDWRKEVGSGSSTDPTP